MCENLEYKKNKAKGLRAIRMTKDEMFYRPTGDVSKDFCTILVIYSYYMYLHIPVEINEYKRARVEGKYV